MPAIPYLVPEFVSVAAKKSVPHSGGHFPLFFLGFVHAGFSVFSVFAALSGFQGSRSGIPVFPFFSAFSVFFRFFRLFRFSRGNLNRVLLIGF